MSTELTTQPKAQIAVTNRGVHLQTVEDAMRFSKAVIMAGMAPQSFKTPESVFIAIQYGAEVGFPPMQALQSIAVVNGRPCLWGDALPALVRQSGKCEYIKEWIEGEGDQRTAHCETKRTDETEPCRRSFSVADAKKANLWGKRGPWSDYPDRMLGMRARSWCFRDTYADAMRGLGVREEVADYSPMPVVASEPPPVRRLSDLGTPAEPEAAPETNSVFASLLADARKITDATSDEAAQLMNDISAELDAGTITADQASELRGIVRNAIPFGEDHK